MSYRRKTSFAAIALVSILGILIAGCGNPDPNLDTSHAINMTSLAEMPVEVQKAPVTVQQAYQFAVANPEVLSQIPCYCGCGGMGHTSNTSCYLQDTLGSEELVFDGHALGCSICVDITQDTMRLLKNGAELPEIQAYIDRKYAQFGPSNIP